MKKFALLALMITCGLCPPVLAGSQSIQFDYDSVSADLGVDTDLSWEAIGRPVYMEMDGERYSSSAGKYMIQDLIIPLKSGDKYRMMLTCSSLDKSYACLGIQLVIVDERKTPATVIQNVKLGDGYSPEIITAPEDANNIMFRVIRAGENTEANVYAINPVTGRLDEKLPITRRFPERMKLKVTCVMKPGGIMEAVSELPSVRRTIDMSEVLDALVEDELYQSDSNPIKALENLRLVRGGWEEENLYREGRETRIDVGMSLITLSQKPVIDVTAVLKQDNNENWVVSELRFEPSMPYK